MKIELTDKERLFLANQHEILGHLNKDNSDYHFKLAEQLRDGHEWLYSQSFDNFSENLPDDAAELVLNILQIYEMIQDAYDGLSDKSLISEHQIKFLVLMAIMKLNLWVSLMLWRRTIVLLM